MKSDFSDYDEKLDQEVSEVKADIVLLGNNVGPDSLSKSFIRDVVDMEEYVGYVPRSIIFPKANLEHLSIYDLAQKGEYARDRYTSFYKKVDEAYAAVLQRLIT